MKNKKIFLTISAIFLVLTLLNFASAITIKDVESSPSEVAPGQRVDTTIRIENIFDYDVSNINVKMDLSTAPFAPHQSSSEKFLDALDSEEDEDFTFKLVALPETASGIYKIPVEITYEDNEGINKSKKETISLVVNSNPELKISLDDSATLIKGQENEISIKIINSGLSDVKFVYLTISDSIGINFLSEKEQYIGDIDSDDFDTIRYSAYISKTSSNLINTPVVLKYKDSTNKDFLETKTLSLRVYSLEEAQNLGIVEKPSYTLYYILGAIVLIYLVYRWRKKRRLRKLKEGR
ncbi:MAG: hypothetical protein Q8P15_02195 [Nanoarchaeota archaeon]|nr:hypothetical protein [Nanoarchaeota archaeon]